LEVKPQPLSSIAKWDNPGYCTRRRAAGDNPVKVKTSEGNSAVRAGQAPVRCQGKEVPQPELYGWSGRKRMDFLTGSVMHVAPAPAVALRLREIKPKKEMHILWRPNFVWRSPPKPFMAPSPTL